MRMTERDFGICKKILILEGIMRGTFMLIMMNIIGVAMGFVTPFFLAATGIWGTVIILLLWLKQRLLINTIEDYEEGLL